MPESPPSALTPVLAAPLPEQHFARAFKPIRRVRFAAHGKTLSAAALVPLFAVAALYLAGISLTHCFYLPPGPLLLCMVAFGAIALAAIFAASRLAWLPITVLWIGLGFWSAEMQPQPVANPDLALCVSDGLLRTVEGTIAAAEPMRVDSEQQDEDSDPSAAFLGEGEPSRGSGAARLRQQVDLDLAAAEIVTDTEDRMQAIPRGGVSRIRLELYWPAGTRARELDCGEKIRIVVRLQSPEVFRDPGVWNRAAYLETQQVAATATLNAARRDSDGPRLVALGAEKRSPACLLSNLRKKIDRRLADLPARSERLPRWFRASSADAAMLTALLTGDRTALTRGIRAGFERTGSFHLVVVSGLHLAIVAGGVFALTRRLRAGRIAATLLTIAAAFAYAVFTGFGVPVQRSFWMVTLYLLGRLLYRDRSPLNVIGFAALSLTVADPGSIFDASFQMTLLAVTAIAGIAVPLLEPGVQARIRALRELRQVRLDVKLAPHIAAFRVLVRLLGEELEAAWGRRMGWQIMPGALKAGLRLVELLCVTAIVELALALPMAIYFHRMTLYALPVNLGLLPLLSVMLPVAMILLGCIVISPAAAVLPAAACVALLHAGILVVSKLGHWTGADLRLPGPGAAGTVLALGLFLLAVWLIRIGTQTKRRVLRWPAIAAWAGMAALVGMATLAVAPRAIERPAGALLFEAIDVGQGDSLLLITPDGHTLLVDGGGLGLPFLAGAKQRAAAFDTGEDVVSPTLWARGIRRLDAVALSHAHHDHMGGLPAILRNFRPRELWVGSNPTVGAYQDLLHIADSVGVPVRHLVAGEEFFLGDAQVRVIGPMAGYRPGAQPSNEDSLVLRVSYGSDSVLLTGDAEKGEEQAMLADGQLGSTVLKVGHHGSMTSTRPAFLAAVHPLWAVISCGRRNRFGHPREEILEELQAAHVRTYRTDLDGAICLAMDVRSAVSQVGCER